MNLLHSTLNLRVFQVLRSKTCRVCRLIFFIVDKTQSQTRHSERYASTARLLRSNVSESPHYIKQMLNQVQHDKSQVCKGAVLGRCTMKDCRVTPDNDTGHPPGNARAAVFGCFDYAQQPGLSCRLVSVAEPQPPGYGCCQALVLAFQI